MNLINFTVKESAAIFAAASSLVNAYAKATNEVRAMFSSERDLYTYAMCVAWSFMEWSKQSVSACDDKALPELLHAGFGKAFFNCDARHYSLVLKAGSHDLSYWTKPEADALFRSVACDPALELPLIFKKNNGVPLRMKVPALELPAPVPPPLYKYWDVYTCLPAHETADGCEVQVRYGDLYHSNNLRFAVRGVTDEGSQHLTYCNTYDALWITLLSLNPLLRELSVSQLPAIGPKTVVECKEAMEITQMIAIPSPDLLYHLRHTMDHDAQPESVAAGVECQPAVGPSTVVECKEAMEITQVTAIPAPPTST